MTYRSDIDGLRAVAVCLVVLAHYNVKYFGGGFIGVDVFFVISGFLITRLILKEIQEERFSLVGFYARRFKRILPALLVVIGVSLAIGWLILLPADFESLGEQAIYASVGVSNIFFWTESGYFAKAAEKLPLLHTWSLGVEEQFYLIWPIVMVAALGWMKASSYILLTGVLGITFASFSFMIWFTASDADFAFYMLPARAWQLGVGAAVALMPVLAKSWVSRTFEISGLILIFGSLAFITEETIYPSFLALAPTIGAALLVTEKSQISFIYKILSTRVVNFIGRASYSIYLWHWPILVYFVFWNNGNDPILFETVLLVALTVTISALSYRYIETPIRQSSFKGFKTISVGLLASLNVALIGFWVWSSEGLQSRLPDKARLIATYMEKPTNRPNRPVCNIARGGDEFSSSCLSEIRFGHSVLYLGDSHANAMIGPARDLLPEIYIHRATSVHCLPTINTKATRNTDSAHACVEYYNNLFEQHIASHPYQTVIIQARWGNGDWSQIGETVSFFVRNKSRVIVIGPTIEYNDDLPQILLQFALPRREILESWEFLTRFEKIKKIDSEMKVLVESSGGEYLSVLEQLCRTKESCISATPDGIPISWDYGHFTWPGATFILEKFRDQGFALP